MPPAITETKLDPAKTPANPEALTPEQQSQLYATGALFHALAADPKYREEVLRLIKKAAPNTPIPELDLQEKIAASLGEKLKPDTEAQKALTERLDRLERRQQREIWMGENALTEEEAGEIETLAKEEKIGSSKAAIELYRSRQALGTPRGTRRATAGAEEYLTKLHKVSPRNGKRLQALAMEEGARILGAIRRGTR